VVAYEFNCKRGPTVLEAIRGSNFNVDVLSVDVAIPQTLAKCLKLGGVRIGGPRDQVANIWRAGCRTQRDAAAPDQDADSNHLECASEEIAAAPRRECDVMCIRLI
jgi:hypothetical protein